MLFQMLNFDRGVVSDRRKRGMEHLYDAHRMRRAIEEIGIAEGDVARARFHLPPDVFEHGIPLHNTKLALIDRNDGAMAAQMFASPACLGVAGRYLRVTVPQMRVGIEWRQSGTIGSLWR